MRCIVANDFYPQIIQPVINRLGFVAIGIVEERVEFAFADLLGALAFGDQCLNRRGAFFTIFGAWLLCHTFPALAFRCNSPVLT